MCKEVAGYLTKHARIAASFNQNGIMVIGESVSPISRYRAGWAAKKRQSCSSSRLTLQCSRCGAGSASFASFQLCLSFKGKYPPEERGGDDGGHENHEGNDEDLDLVVMIMRRRLTR